ERRIAIEKAANAQIGVDATRQRQGGEHESRHRLKRGHMLANTAGCTGLAHAMLLPRNLFADKWRRRHFTVRKAVHVAATDPDVRTARAAKGPAFTGRPIEVDHLRLLGFVIGTGHVVGVSNLALSDQDALVASRTVDHEI